MRWAQWFEETGEIAGVPEEHCMRYRSQREQVAAVWANNRRTFLSTDEHVDALVHSLDALEGLVEGSDDELWAKLSANTGPRRPVACTSGIAALLRRLLGRFGQ